MKRIWYSLLIILFALPAFASLNSCREDKKPGEKIEEGMEDAADEVEDEVEEMADDN